MTDERREAATSWLKESSHKIMTEHKGYIMPTLVDAHLAGQESRQEEIDALRGMVRDLYLWLNAALDDELTDEGREALRGEVPNSRWREIKAVVGEAADMDEQP